MNDALRGMFTIICVCFAVGLIVGPPYGGIAAFCTGTIIVLGLLFRGPP